ncbi:MAG: hypothetical protein AUI36_12130 [Cyanobacteria bacterium 13_1_40CM_2_61_4]|nr:MAG: hypothetical protein AUI36_12130 [Cyanobacteria bacterium 13_1_40CM_2_61_4]
MKQLHLAIEAFAALKQIYPDASLVIAGDGEERSNLEILARKRITDNSVNFLGEVDRTEVAALLRTSVALLMPSAAEGFPMAAIESLASGTPVICSSTGGLTDLVRDGINGYFVDPSSPTSFAATLKRAIEDFPQLGRACVDSAQQYSIDRVGPLVEEALVQSSGRSTSH